MPQQINVSVDTHTSPLGFFALALTAVRGDLSCLVIDSSFTLVGEEDYRLDYTPRGVISESQ